MEIPTRRIEQSLRRYVIPPSFRLVIVVICTAFLVNSEFQQYPFVLPSFQTCSLHSALMTSPPNRVADGQSEAQRAAIRLLAIQQKDAKSPTRHSSPQTAVSALKSHPSPLPVHSRAREERSVRPALEQRAYSASLHSPSLPLAVSLPTPKQPIFL